MSLAGSSERIGFLRETLVRIEAQINSADARANAAWRGHKADRIALGAQNFSLDRMLGGGLQRGALHDIVGANPRDAAAASAFASALAIRFGNVRARGAFLWIVEDIGVREEGMPYAPGLRLHGLDPARLLLVRTINVRDTFWVMEEGLKCKGVSAVLAETWAKARDYSLTVSRRLALAARAGGTAGLLRHAAAAGEADAITSAAATRFEIAARRSLPVPAAGRGPPLPGPAAWGVRVARMRAGAAGLGRALDWQKFSDVAWDHEETCFRDALSLPLVAAPRNRPARAGTPARLLSFSSRTLSDVDENQRRAASRVA
ncbi:MAG: protein ImuA [Methylobacteriaceae bacterium]|jgi:protein ImuA|nr:protein ImuA [Methylobacteriaceae bacterium]